MALISMWDKQGNLIRTFNVVAANTYPAGITTDRKYLWVVNGDNNQFEQYDKQGNLIDSVAIAGIIFGAGGLTTDRKYLWTSDVFIPLVNQYNKQGNLIDGWVPQNSVWDLTTDRKYLWTLECDGDVATYIGQYDKQGNNIQLIDITAILGIIEGGGITTDSKYLWIVDSNNAMVRQYDKQGNLIDSWACAPGGELPICITTDRKYLWITSI